MRFGIEFGSYPVELDPVEVCREITRRAQVAYKNNFESLFVAQHYATGPDSAILQSLPLLSYLAGQVPGMYLGTSIFLLPLHPPVMVAEYTSTLDNLSGGKFLFGVGQGYREAEFNAFGIDKRHRKARLVEALEIIQKLWSEDRVTFHGRFFKLDGVSIAPKPLQRPRPPILMGADTLKTVAQVPVVADHWIASRRHSKAFLREALPSYKAALERNGKEFKGLFIFRDLCIADSLKEAENRVRGAYEQRYQRYQQEGQPGERYDLPFDELKQDRLILGSPAEVVEQVMAYHEEFGAEFMWFMVDWPGMDPRFTLESIERFGKEVIPEIKRATPSCPVP
ncbi:MAG TPA: LLM class flavin-dependent oxidoreductase [Candidatus Binatia bacterium]|jgi:alkanesulfonate monooxygenase SsuD/methylene tetrahydromethanopterin reductase-like flavin-dependent oxidoreductase (luciferase family)